jgi:hypothetical protein
MIGAVIAGAALQELARIEIIRDVVCLGAANNKQRRSHGERE